MPVLKSFFGFGKKTKVSNYGRNSSAHKTVQTTQVSFLLASLLPMFVMEKCSPYGRLFFLHVRLFKASHEYLELHLFLTVL